MKFNYLSDTYLPTTEQRLHGIDPGKLTVADSFRVGCIGRLDNHVVRAAGDVLAKLGVDDAAPPQSSLEEKTKLAA